MFLLCTQTSWGTTPLIAAAAKGHLDVVKYLVQRGAIIEDNVSQNLKDRGE
jgi:ankyrin repeat protein